MYLCGDLSYESETTRSICFGIWTWDDGITFLSSEFYTYDNLNLTCGFIHIIDTLLIFEEVIFYEGSRSE